NGNGADTGDSLGVVAVNGIPQAIGRQITLPSGARVFVDANGTFEYDPTGAFTDLAEGAQITDSFVYALSDGTGNDGLGGFTAVKELSALDGTNGFAITGFPSYVYSGYAVSSAGDVNGDGIDDVIIGVEARDSNGESYVVFGTDTGFGASLELSALDGTNGFVINGIDEYDHSGASVSSAGDVNGDGIDDLIIEGHGSPNGLYSGESHVVFGTDTGFGARLELSALDGTNGFTLNGIDSFDLSGTSVSSAGDVNGDGIGDVIIGSVFASPNGVSSGESYVVFGKTTGFGASFELSVLDGTNGFVINGIDEGDYSGTSVSSAGDVNGDGIDDVIIGASFAEPNGRRSGESYVVFGKDTGFGASLELSALDGTNGFVINGIDSYDYSGTSVSSAGDVNGDGIDDVIIGANLADPNGLYSGESYVMFGTDTGFGPSFELSALDGTNGFVINGIGEYDHSGTSVSSAGDVNGDGIDDVIIGAHDADPNGVSSGESYVVFGKTTSFGASLELSALDGTNGYIINGIDVGDKSGTSVSSAGDVNGDGIDDVIIGASNANPNGPVSGESYVVFGRSSSTPGIDIATVSVTVTGVTNDDIYGDGYQA
ncbi:MAG: FG-GAP repeat protein, partial [Thalassovita sp.]